MEKLTFWQIAKSKGALILVGLAIILTIVAAVNGQFDGIKEGFTDFLLNLVIYIAYVILRAVPGVDSNWFDKK